MRRWPWLAGGALALVSTFALAAPESLLPPGFSNPAPTPSPTASPTPSPTATRPAARPVPAPGGDTGTPAGPAAGNPSATASPVVQALPETGQAGAGLPLPDILADLPSLAELEEMDADEIDQLFGLQPEFDIPPAARRAVRRVGVIGREEGGFASASLAGQPADLVRAALSALRDPLVSRWGHILLRRALASRLDAPGDMDPVEFAALRARALNALGEPAIARALVQDVDSSNYDPALARAAFDAYLASGDVLGICPVARLRADLIDDPRWDMARAICAGYAGQERRAERELARAGDRGGVETVDVLLARRFAGAAGERRRAFNIEWDGVEDLSGWRFGLARALGVEIPAGLIADADPDLRMRDALIPAVPLAQRVAGADIAGERGVLSSEAMVDLYSQLYADDGVDDDAREPAVLLRRAFVADGVEGRLAAMRELWGETRSYGRRVLTARAAARMPVGESLADAAPDLLASMLAAGLDRNAARWASVVEDGSLGWALVALARPGRVAVDDADLRTFVGDGEGGGPRKARFLFAGLAGLGRIDRDTADDVAERLGLDLDRQSPWSRRIDRAGELGNPAVVALLAGVGMQGTGWDRMTARHLFHIVRALNRAGLDAEARMIAAEAVARG